MWATVIELFRNYMGTGLVVAWFLMSLLYLYFKEADKGKRILFLYVPVILLLLFFNPIFIEIIYRFVGDEIYYRVLWLLPITVVLAYTVVDIKSRLQGAKGRIFLGMAILLVILSGSCIYSNTSFQRANNLNHIPQPVVNICEAIKVEGREVLAVFPDEMLIYVRQYSPVICMPYGREVLVKRWNRDDDLHAVLSKEVIRVDLVAELAKDYGCHYVILHQTRKLTGDMEDYDYILYDTIDGYDIYLDTTMYIGL